MTRILYANALFRAPRMRKKILVTKTNRHTSNEQCIIFSLNMQQDKINVAVSYLISSLLHSQKISLFSIEHCCANNQQKACRQETEKRSIWNMKVRDGIFPLSSCLDRRPGLQADERARVLHDGAMEQEAGVSAPPLTSQNSSAELKPWKAAPVR